MLTDETALRLPARNEPSLFGVVSDFNGDGAADIALVNLKNGLVPGHGNGTYPGVPSVRVLINDGAGGFTTSPAQIMPERLFRGSARTRWTPATSTATGATTSSSSTGASPATRSATACCSTWAAATPSSRGAAGIAYPQINPALDDDGDHPVAADLDGDGRLDVVVAQFATRPYVLMNQLARRPPGAGGVHAAAGPRTRSGFRNKVFDANADGVLDMWLALRDRNFLVLGNRPESEPNQNVAEANPTTTFPSLRTGILYTADEDVFSLPAAASTGARIRLRPASNGDLRLRILNASGASLFVSETAGNGATETIDLANGSGAAFARVELQGAPGGDYRLEILRPGTPFTEEAETLSSAPSRAPRPWPRSTHAGKGSAGPLTGRPATRGCVRPRQVTHVTPDAQPASRVKCSNP